MISIIVAIARNGAIGAGNQLIWHIGEDLRRFKRITTGHPVVMGRKTYESIGRPLPGRENIVVSRQCGLCLEGVTVVDSLEQALASYADADDREVFVIGGGELYAQALPLADRLYVTWVDQTPEADTFFPIIDPAQWRIVWSETHSGYTFTDYVRICCKAE